MYTHWQVDELPPVPGKPDWLRTPAFLLSCLLSLGAFLWNAFALGGYVRFPSGIWTLEALFMSWAVLLTISDQRFRRYSAWKPLWTPTPKRIRTARILILASVLYLICSWTAIFAMSMLRSQEAERWIVVGLSSFILATTIPAGAMWALHPENLATQKTLRLLKNPLLFALMPSYRNRNLRRSANELRLIKKENTGRIL